MNDSDEYPAAPVELIVLDKRIETWGLPRYQSAMAAGLDLYACLDETLVLEAQTPAVLVPAGIALHIGSPQIAALILPRSGLAHKRGLVLGNSVGLIDGDYTGPILISVWNRNEPGREPIVITPGDRIAQLIFVPIVRPTLAIVAEFSQTSPRGAGGFGSTGHGSGSAP